MGSNPPTFRTNHQHRYHIHQAKKLSQYLAGGGLMAAYGAGFGAQLDRLAAAGAGFSPCRRCGGDPTDDTGGSGYVPRNPAKYRAAKKRHRSYWRKRGIKVNNAFLSPVAILSHLELERCPRCDGRGWVTRRARGAVNAQPTTPGMRAPSGHMLDDNRVQILGRVGRWLATVTAQNAQHGQCLEVYFGPNGGTLRACWHLTPPGLTMLRQRKPDEAPLQCFDRLWQQQQSSFKDFNRDRLMLAADKAAENLLECACETWNDVVPDEDSEAEATLWRHCEAICGVRS